MLKAAAEMIDPLNRYPGYLLRRASLAAMVALATRLAPLDLRPGEATVLTVIEANPNSTQSDIGRLLEIARANMAPLVSRLASRELIERQPVDRRSHGLVLTRSGRSLVARIKAAFAAHEQTLLENIPASHRNAFISGLQALAEKTSNGN